MVQKGSNGRKICTKKYSQPNLAHSGLPVVFCPCPHQHLKSPPVDRKSLDKEQYINMLATPRGYTWDNPKQDSKNSSCKLRCNKQKQSNDWNDDKGPQCGSAQRMENLLKCMTPEMCEKLMGIFVKDFNIPKDDAKQFIDDQKSNNKNNKMAMCKCPCAATGDADQNVWMKDFTDLVSCKLKDQLAVVMCGWRTKRQKSLMEILVNVINDLLCETISMSCPETRLHRALIFAIDRIACWLDKMYDDASKRAAAEEEEDRMRRDAEDEERRRREEEERRLREAKLPEESAVTLASQESKVTVQKSKVESAHTIASQKDDEEEARRRQAEEDERARLRAEEEERARLRAEEEERARLRAEEEERRRQAEEDERARLRAEEEERARLQAEEDERARLRAEEEERARLQAEEDERARLAEEEMRETEEIQRGEEVVSKAAVELVVEEPFEEFVVYEEAVVSEAKEEPKGFDPMSIIVDWIEETQYDKTERQKEIGKIVKRRLTEGLAEYRGEEGLGKAIDCLGNKVSTWIDKLAEAAEKEIKPLISLARRFQAPKGILYHVKKGDDNYYNVKQVSCDDLAEHNLKINRAMTSDDIKDFTKWAEGLIIVSDAWTKWVENAFCEAYTMYTRNANQPSELTAKEFQAWREKKRQEAIDWKRAQKSIYNKAQRWEEWARYTKNDIEDCQYFCEGKVGYMD